jgi:hypothetical protein
MIPDALGEMNSLTYLKVENFINQKEHKKKKKPCGD